MGLEEAFKALGAHVSSAVGQQRHTVHRGVRQREDVARGVEAALAVRDHKAAAGDVVGPVREGLHCLVVGSERGWGRRA